MLHVERLQAAYGISQVLFDLNLSVASSELVTLLGRNGMGKTTPLSRIAISESEYNMEHAP